MHSTAQTFILHRAAELLNLKYERSRIKEILAILPDVDRVKKVISKIIKL